MKYKANNISRLIKFSNVINKFMLTSALLGNPKNLFGGECKLQTHNLNGTSNLYKEHCISHFKITEFEERTLIRLLVFNVIFK